MTEQDDLFSGPKADFVAQIGGASPPVFNITFREAASGEEALLGDNVIGRVNLHPHAEKKKASWISFIPNRAGIRMIGPISVTDQTEARRALIECMRAWLHNCAVAAS